MQTIETWARIKIDSRCDFGTKAPMREVSKYASRQIFWDACAIAEAAFY